MSGEVCWLHVRGRLGFLRKRISRKEKEKEEGTKYIKGFLPDERNSQVGLGSVRKGASSSIFPRINLLFCTKYKKKVLALGDQLLNLKLNLITACSG